jgi:hypothetical protein
MNGTVYTVVQSQSEQGDALFARRPDSAIAVLRAGRQVLLEHLQEQAARGVFRSGAYVLHDPVRDRFYVGQSGHLLSRLRTHVGNQDRGFATAWVLDLSGFGEGSLKAVERALIDLFSETPRLLANGNGGHRETSAHHDELVARQSLPECRRLLSLTHFDAALRMAELSHDTESVETENPVPSAPTEAGAPAAGSETGTAPRRLPWIDFETAGLIGQMLRYRPPAGVADPGIRAEIVGRRQVRIRWPDGRADETPRSIKTATIAARDFLGLPIDIGIDGPFQWTVETDPQQRRLREFWAELVRQTDADRVSSG